jgi:hypothetical protein
VRVIACGDAITIKTVTSWFSSNSMLHLTSSFPSQETTQRNSRH